jgi:hypothetical protein
MYVVSASTVICFALLRAGRPLYVLEMPLQRTQALCLPIHGLSPLHLGRSVTVVRRTVSTELSTTTVAPDTGQSMERPAVSTFLLLSF